MCSWSRAARQPTRSQVMPGLLEPSEGGGLRHAVVVQVAPPTVTVMSVPDICHDSGDGLAGGHDLEPVGVVDVPPQRRVA